MIPADVLLFLSLLTAHLISDFLLQSDADVRFKRRPLRLAKHVGIVTGVSYLFAGAWAVWWIPLTIAVTHAIIDRLKLLSEDLGWKGRVPFVLDQLAHVAVVAALAFLPSAESVPTVFWATLIGPVFAQGCLVVAGGIVAIHAGGYLIGMSIAPYLEEVLAVKRDRRATGGETLLEDAPTAEGLAKGGMVIGQLERALIFFFVLVGQPQAVAFLVAAKSVFRFGELSKSRKEAEYILIGTLMSFGWSLLAAWATGYAAGQLGLF